MFVALAFIAWVGGIIHPSPLTAFAASALSFCIGAFWGAGYVRRRLASED